MAGVHGHFLEEVGCELDLKGEPGTDLRRVTPSRGHSRSKNIGLASGEDPHFRAEKG